MGLRFYHLPKPPHSPSPQPQLSRVCGGNGRMDGNVVARVLRPVADMRSSPAAHEAEQT